MLSVILSKGKHGFILWWDGIRWFIGTTSGTPPTNMMTLPRVGGRKTILSFYALFFSQVLYMIYVGWGNDNMMFLLVQNHSRTNNLHSELL